MSSNVASVVYATVACVLFLPIIILFVGLWVASVRQAVRLVFAVWRTGLR